MEAGYDPERWRPRIRAIVESLKRRDRILGADRPDVERVAAELTARDGDLWSAEAGRTDLVLELTVVGDRFRVGLVYPP